MNKQIHLIKMTKMMYTLTRLHLISSLNMKYNILDKHLDRIHSTRGKTHWVDDLQTNNKMCSLPAMNPLSPLSVFLFVG